MKKLVSLLLALVLSLSMVGCGTQPAPVPAPDQTLNALMLTLFREDTTAMGELFGYSSRDAVLADWLDGKDPRDLMISEFVDGFAGSALQEGITVDAETVNATGKAVLDAVARVPFTCTTDMADETSGTAVVTVSINPFPEDCFGDAMLNYVYTNHLDELLATANAPAEMYRVIFSAITDYMQQLQPVTEVTSFTVHCELTEDVVNGETRTFWLPADAEAFGEQFIFTIFDIA